MAATANDTTENTAVDLEELEVKANTVVMDGKRTTLIPTPCDKKFAWFSVITLELPASPHGDS